MKGTLSDVDQAIGVIRYEIKRKRKRLEEQERKAELGEKEKFYIDAENKFIVSVETLIDGFRKAIDMNLGKMSPQAVDLEEGVLGAVMLGTATTAIAPPAIDVVKSFLKPEHFSVPAHRELYGAVLTMREAGQPIDMRTVYHHLRKTGKAIEAGGAYYIAELTSRVSSAANIEYHARIVVEMAMKRELIKMSGDLMAQGYDDEADCFDMLDFAKREVKKIMRWVRR